MRLDLNPHILTQLIKRRNRSRLRRIMRGYRYLKQADQLGLIRRVLGDLTNTRLCISGHDISPLFYGAGFSQAEIITRQYLLIRFGGIWLNKALLHSLGSGKSPVIHPLPKVWQEILIKHGFSVARMRCSIAWAGYVGMIWAHGVLGIVKHILAAVHRMIWPISDIPGRYVYFHDLTAGNLPQPCRDGRSHDIVTWYLRWKGRAERLNTLRHGVREAKASVAEGMRVEYADKVIPPLANLVSLLRFTDWSFRAIFRSVFDALRGHWWHALLLGESSAAARVRFLKPLDLARDYLFHNSGYIYRPLWTYEAKEKGSRILLYFYSTAEVFKLPQGYEPDNIELGAMNWPLYLVWDKYQENLIRRAVGDDVRIEVVGPIWFQSSAIELPELPKKSVAVFDIQPHRGSAHFAFSTMADLYGGRNVENKFLLDIHSALHERGGTMVHKRKRHIGKRLNPSYAALIGRLSQKSGVIAIEPDTSAIRVIESCQAVISMPFTATALLGIEQGKPSIYYDPLGVIQKDDRAAHGVKILSGPKELRGWLTAVLA